MFRSYPFAAEMFHQGEIPKRLIQATIAPGAFTFRGGRRSGRSFCHAGQPAGEIAAHGHAHGYAGIVMN